MIRNTDKGLIRAFFLGDFVLVFKPGHSAPTKMPSDRFSETYGEVR